MWLLQKEFPHLKSFELPSYKITYSRKGKHLILKLLFQIPSIILSVLKERMVVGKIIKLEHICGIISDSRFGVFHKNIPSVYITHQINVLSGFTTFLTSKVHQKFIRKYTECWIPDFKDEPNFSGKLGHIKNTGLKVKYIGILSRFDCEELSKRYDIIVVLSGPEPQRTIFENLLLEETKKITKKILIVRGIFNSNSILSKSQNIEIVNYLTSNLLEKALNESDLVIARSGYSSIMDMAALGKKVFFVPTPGQKEQEYLAEMLANKKIAPFLKQTGFRIENLNELSNYMGFPKVTNMLNSSIFSLFKGK